MHLQRLCRGHHNGAQATPPHASRELRTVGSVVRAEKAVVHKDLDTLTPGTEVELLRLKECGENKALLT